MDIPFDIGKTIGSRRSVRSFRAEPLDAGTLGRLSEFSKALPLPFPCATRAIFFKAEPTLELYTSMRSPPDNVAFASETDIVSLAKTGFAGELVILMAESLGVSTCWFGYYRLAELERLVPDLRGSERPGEARGGFGYPKHAEGNVRAICLSPLGHYEDGGLRLVDRVAKSAFGSRRKEIRELLEEPGDMASLPEDVLYALDLARKAPSAVNSRCGASASGTGTGR